MHRKKIWMIIGICVAAVCLLTAVSLIAIRQTNRYTLALTLQGETEMVLEYGQKYEEPGAEAAFWGTLFDKEQISVDVSVERNFGKFLPGTYLVKYLTSYRGITATAYRRVHIVDTCAPVISLDGDPDKFTFPNEPYQEEGFRAVDNCDGDITDQVLRTESGGVITYTVTDSSGNQTVVNRKVLYDDPIAPEITLKGGGKVVLARGQTYVEPGFSATDNCDGDITGKVSVSGLVDVNWPGNYTLVYTVKDTFNNVTSVSRTVHVKSTALNTQNVQPNGKVIYLTFDDGPSKYTNELLDILKKYEVKATFFVVKTRYISTIKRAAAEGHTIAVHSASHKFKSIYASEDAYFKDLYGMQKIIKDLTGQETNLLRFPGGSSNTASRFNKGIMTRLTRKVQEKGFYYFDWNVDSNDAGGTTTAKGVFNNVIKGVKKRKVSIVLQHDTKKYSVAAVEQIIIWGLENGYTFRALDANSPGAHHGINN